MVQGNRGIGERTAGLQQPIAPLRKWNTLKCERHDPNTDDRMLLHIQPGGFEIQRHQRHLTDGGIGRRTARRIKSFEQWSPDFAGLLLHISRPWESLFALDLTL